eukprot:1161936-Pelagomonas_calceolata.AAC.3
MAEGVAAAAQREASGHLYRNSNLMSWVWCWASFTRLAALMNVSQCHVGMIPCLQKNTVETIGPRTSLSAPNSNTAISVLLFFKGLGSRALHTFLLGASKGTCTLDPLKQLGLGCTYKDQPKISQIV